MRTIKQNNNNNSLLILLITLLALILLSSCDITKQATKTKTDKDLQETILTKTIRVGDTVRYEVPKVFLKDTTIYTYNKQGSTLVTSYNNKGNISDIECLTSNIDLLIEENRRLTENKKNKDKEKEENFDSEIILYSFLGLGILFVVVGGIFVYLISKQIKPFTRLLTKTTE